jgi:hypothetical protein
MTRMMGALLLLGACGDPSANCEFEVNGVTVCLSDAMSVSYCRAEVGGTATRHDSSDDPGCRALGYEVECEGTITQQGDNFTADHAGFRAATEEDCAAATGGSFEG